MAEVVHRFLFWTWKTHKHEWVEEGRGTYTTKRRIYPGEWFEEGAVTMFLYRCSECQLVKVEEVPGEWPPGGAA